MHLPRGVASVSTLNSGDQKEDLGVRIRATSRERQLDGSGSSLLSTSPSTACVHSLLTGAPWPCSRLRGPSTARPAVRAQCLCADRRRKVLRTAEDAWGPWHVPGLLSSRAFAPPRVSWSQGLPTKEGTSLLSLSLPGQQGTSLRASAGLFSPERGLVLRPTGCPRTRKQSPTFRALQTHLRGESEIRVCGLHVQGLWCGPNLPCVQVCGEPAIPPPPQPGEGHSVSPPTSVSRLETLHPPGCLLSCAKASSGAVQAFVSFEQNSQRISACLGCVMAQALFPNQFLSPSDYRVLGSSEQIKSPHFHSVFVSWS